MMGLDEEDYYNPTPLQSGAERKDEDSSHLNVVSPIMVNDLKSARELSISGGSIL
jgi:hypothetical protein